MIDHNGSWLPSVWAGIPALVVGAIVFTVFAGWLWFISEEIVEYWFVGIMWTIVVVIATIGGPLVGYWPYKGDYHRLQPATGIVKTVDTRFMAASQYVIITYTTGLTVRCDDSRCATVRVGDSLRLLCTKEYQYGSVDGWGCRWGQE